MNTINSFEGGREIATFTLIILSYCLAEMKEMQLPMLFRENLHAFVGILMQVEIKTQSKFSVWRRNCTTANFVLSYRTLKPKFLCVYVYTITHLTVYILYVRYIHRRFQYEKYSKFFM